MILPMYTSPDARFSFHLQAILRPQLFGWFYTHFIDFCMSNEGQIFYYDDQTDESYRKFFCSRIVNNYREILADSEYCSLMKSRLDKGYYHFVWVDKFYVPGSDEYEKYHFVHPVMLYGYEGEDFVILNFSGERGNIHCRVPQKALMEGIANVFPENPDAPYTFVTETVTCFRLSELVQIPYSITELTDQLRAYLGIPYPDITAPNLSSYYAMLYQLGGALYNDAATHTTINSEAGVQAFERYTSLYNDYGLPTIFDFVSRFRSGEMPLGIFDYTTFNTLTVSAPEIRGLWDIAILPGTSRTAEDGSTYVDHSGHSQGACCMMIATDSETTKQHAWQFMKWWTSTDAQVRFGREIEAVLGSSARYATANIAAIEQLSWSEAQLKVIREQMTWAVGFREVAGGYYTTRHMTNAVRKVTNDKTDPRETLLDYARTINEEINKKRLEFGLPIDEETP